MLKTETNTVEMEARIRKAFEHSELYTHSCQTDFEHGQWWVSCYACGAQWSVCDDNSSLGFCFEEVSPGDEEGHRCPGDEEGHR